MNSFRPPFRPQKKKNWFMLKQGLNCNFNFYIVKNWSASWWPNLVTNIVFDLMGLLWDVCWPHWPNLAKIRRPPSVRSVSLTTGLAVKYNHSYVKNDCTTWFKGMCLNGTVSSTEKVKIWNEVIFCAGQFSKTVNATARQNYPDWFFFFFFE